MRLHVLPPEEAARSRAPLLSGQGALLEAGFLRVFRVFWVLRACADTVDLGIRELPGAEARLAEAAARLDELAASLTSMQAKAGGQPLRLLPLCS
jgi:hypothetical protein